MNHIEWDHLFIVLVHENVIQNKIPVVLLEGTGGCCDLFAKCYRLYNEYHPKMKLSDQIKFVRLFSEDYLFSFVVFSEDPSTIREKNEQIKTKLREKLQIIDNKLNSGSMMNLSDGIDYFELIYECIETRNIFLNFIDLKVHSHIEPDIDLAILQALLNGKQNIFVILNKSFYVINSNIWKWFIGKE